MKFTSIAFIGAIQAAKLKETPTAAELATPAREHINYDMLCH